MSKDNNINLHKRKIDMTKQLRKMITDDINKAYTGESEVTLSQALARLCAEFYDPHMKFDNDKGVYEEVNQHHWEQYFFMQNITNHVWASLHDTRTNNKGYVKGAKHKLDKAQASLKQQVQMYDGSEISLNNITRSEAWVQTLEAKVLLQEEMFHTMAYVLEEATGQEYKPYEPWTKTVDKPVASSDKEAELHAKLLERGIDLSVGSAANTDGVATTEKDKGVA
tara:strand:+ start:328 stop:999 length:672 start_codon:yes stop_codon:yes gene_type:complete